MSATDFPPGYNERLVVALESIAASLKVMPDAGEWLESCANRIEVKLDDLNLIVDRGLNSIEMTITRARQS